MKHTDDNNIQEKPIFMIENSDSQTSSQELLEEPVITIEEDNDGVEVNQMACVKQPSRRKIWTMRLLGLLAVVVLMLVCYKGLRLYNYYYNIGVSVSVSPKDNINKLESMKSQGVASQSAENSATTDGAAAHTSEVALKSDSVLGVALNIYEPRNVAAELTLEEPDIADHSVLMCTRTADYTVTGKYIGSLVVDGEEKQSDVSRLGYCAIESGNMVIGISRFDNVKDYVIDHDGSYFRQFILVSNGELPKRFFLHGKVERKALARTADDHLCIVETRHPETLWDFADALREYGYVDAIYLTGGNECGFYRAPDGIVYFSEKAPMYHKSKHHGVAPWLVLRKR